MPELVMDCSYPKFQSPNLLFSSNDGLQYYNKPNTENKFSLKFWESNAAGCDMHA